jgi:chromosome partitioning protein
LAATGERVLIIDLDPQGNASTGLGIGPDARPLTTYDILAGTTDIASARIKTKVPGVFLLPANHDLVGLEAELMGAQDRPYRLRDALLAFRAALKGGLDKGEPITYVLIDCPPSLSLLTVNAMTAAEAVLVPVQCEFFALEGISQLKDTVEQIRATLNPRLEIQGVVLTMHDQRTAFSREVADNVRGVFGAKVYKTVIPRNVRVAEAPSHGLPVILYDHGCAASEAYMKLATEVIERERKLRAA